MVHMICQSERERTRLENRFRLWQTKWISNVRSTLGRVIELGNYPPPLRCLEGNIINLMQKLRKTTRFPT